MKLCDLIVLGRACPDMTSDGRKTVCLGGYSFEHGFIRIYPTRADTPIRRWDIVEVEVERNPQDTRDESWKIVDSRLGWSDIHKRVRKVGELPRRARLSLLAEISTDCTHTLNKKHQSLGIIQPLHFRGYLETNPKHAGLFQQLLPELDENEGVLTKRDFMVYPRIKYECSSGCNGHDQQLLEWGCYRYIQKNPYQGDRIWENMGFYDSAFTHFFLVGNQARFRTAYMVISCLRQKQSAIQQSFFTLSAA